MNATRLQLVCLALGCLSLDGCASTPRAPDVVEVKVPVYRSCDAPVPARPAFAVDALPIGADIDVQMQALRAERQQRKGYEIELETAVQACR